MHTKVVNRNPSVLWLAIMLTIISASLGLIIFQQMILYGSYQKDPILISLVSFGAFSVSMWGYLPLEKFMLKLDSTLTFLHSCSGHRLIYATSALNIFLIIAILVTGMGVSWITWGVMLLYLGAMASMIRYIPKWDSERMELEYADSRHPYRVYSPIEWFIKVTFMNRARINCEHC